jgi:hypothetical protein
MPMTTPDDQPADDASDGEELMLGPLESRGEVDPRSPSPHIPSSLEPRYLGALPPPEAEPLRYSLRELLILMTLSAVLLSTIRLLGAATFAAVSGVMAFAMLIFISVAKPQNGIIHIGWWILMVIYLIASVVAVVGKNL